jgi:glycerophosphoryl diester phosphodiesterase
MISEYWFRRPIAHRGLHNLDKGVVENTASAFAAAMAIANDYAIECDLQEAACGEPMVFHDESLERLTTGDGLVRQHDARALKATPFRVGEDRMQTLSELLDQVDGRAPLFLEVKGKASQAARFCRRIGDALAQYQGQVAVMSFEPAIVAAFREAAPQIPRGLVSGWHHRADWPELSLWRRLSRTLLLSSAVARPDFIAYNLQSLAAPAPYTPSPCVVGPWVLRRVLGRPMIVWTVRSAEDAERAKAWADAIVFEGFAAK